MSDTITYINSYVNIKKQRREKMDSGYLQDINSISDEMNALEDTFFDVRNKISALQTAVAAAVQNTAGAGVAETDFATVETGVANILNGAPTATQALPGTVELDETGVPWDARIHTGGEIKKMKGRNRWKAKRGVDKTELARIEAELKAAGVPVAPVVAPVAVAPVVAPVAVAPVVAPVAVAAPVVAPVAVAAPVTVSGNVPIPLTDFASLVTGIATGTVNEVKLAKLLTECQCPDVATLANHPDVLTYVIQSLNA